MWRDSTWARSFIKLLAVAVLVAGTSMTQAKSVPSDSAIPVVELMPLTMRYEVYLKLSAEQIKALVGYRKEAMPVRIAVQKKILALRGHLRAMLSNQPPAERAALMQQIAEAEVAHFKGLDHCVEFVRQALSADQFAQLSRACTWMACAKSNSF